MNPSTTWLSCGVLKAEMEQLHRDGQIRGELRFLDSMLHMDPQQLQAVLGAELTELDAKGSRVVLVYGDCCSRMLDLVRQFGINRVSAINCAQMLVGRNRYRELMRDQAFMLLPEWAQRWKEILQGELGLHAEVACDLMRENRRELVYLDTAVAPVPWQAIEECAAYTGLPWRVEKVTLDPLLALLLQAESGDIPRLPEKTDTSSSSSTYYKPTTWADQVMMADVFSEILASSDPSQLAQILMEQMRELTGAHTAILIAHPEGVHSHRIMHVSPARRKSLLTADELSLFCPDFTQVLPLYVKDYQPEHPCRLPLLNAGVSSLMRFLLRTGEDMLATMLLLDLPGADRIDETEKIITHLMPVMALALKNSLIHEKVEQQAQELACHANNLEKLVDQRTRALKESEERYRTLFENAGEAIYVAQDGRVVFINPMTVMITGYSGEEIMSKPFVDFIHEDDREMVKDHHTGRLKGESIPPRYNFRFVHKNGGFRWVELDTVIINWEGKPATLNFMSDINERIRMEEKEKETHALLRIAGEKAKLGGWSVNLEEDRITWSDEVAAIHEMPAGYSPSLEQGISFYAPEWKERITKVFTDCTQKGIPYDEEMEIITAGGKRVWIKTIGEPVKNDAGKIVKVQGAFQDITEHKQAEEELRERESILQKIFDILPVGLWFTDKNGKLLRGNPSGVKIWGAEPCVAPSEYGVFKARRLPSGKEIAPDDWALVHSIKNGMTIVDELLEIDAFDGTKKVILNYTAPVLDDRGKIQCAIVVNQDITDRVQAEEELRTSRAKLSNALVMAHLGHWEYDVANDLFTFNDQFYKIFRTTVDQVGGYTMHSAEYARRFIHPDDIDTVGEETRKAIETTDPDFNRQIEHRMIYADGTIGHITVRFFIIKDTYGKTIKTYGVNQDITERKRAEEALRESLDRSQAILAALDDAVFLVEPTTRLIIECNDAAARIFGYLHEEMVGRGIDFLHIDQMRFAQFSRQLVTALEDHGYFATEFEMRRKDGGVFPTAHFARPVHKPDGRISYVVSVVRDITEHKQAEAKLRQQADAMEASTDGIAILNEDQNYVYVNEAHARIYGYDTSEELIGKSWTVLYNEDELQRFDHKIMPEFIQIGQWRGEATGKKKDGSVFPQEVSLTGLDNGGLICVVRDITNHKLAEDKLRKSLIGTIQALSSTVETRDPYTAGHQKRVSNLARAIAQEMGLPKDTINNIRMAGIIHDIGKVSVPAEILSKPGKLSEIEMSLIKVHSQSGYDILKDVGLPYPIAGIVLQHHERLDGSGYPQGLKGDQILLETKIISVADVVEAMASYRPYRPALGIDFALEEIEKNKGILYDDAVADACLRLFREKGYKIKG